jgi:hypothetical protein
LPGQSLIGGLEDLVSREHVPGADQELSRDGRLRRVGAVAGGEPPVVLVKGVGRSPGLVGRLDRRPTKRPRAGLRQAPGRRALAELDDPRRPACIADQLRGRGEARDVADLRGKGELIKGPTPGIVCSSCAVGPERAVGASSESIGLIRRRSSSICERCSSIESGWGRRCSSECWAPAPLCGLGAYAVKRKGKAPNPSRPGLVGAEKRRPDDRSRAAGRPATIGACGAS